MPAQSDDSRAYGTLVYPAGYNSLFLARPFNGFASLTKDSYSLAVAPPIEVCHAAVAFDAGFGYPLTCISVENVYVTTAFSAGANETDPTATRTKFEALHTALGVRVAHYTGDFFDFAGGEVPDVEVAAAAGEEYFVAGWGVEEGGCEGGGAEVEVCEGGIWVGWVGGNVVEG